MLLRCAPVPHAQAPPPSTWQHAQDSTEAARGALLIQLSCVAQRLMKMFGCSEPRSRNSISQQDMPRDGPWSTSWSTSYRTTDSYNITCMHVPFLARSRGNISTEPSTPESQAVTPLLPNVKMHCQHINQGTSELGDVLNNDHRLHQPYTA